MPAYLAFLAVIAVRTAIVLLLVTAGLRFLGKRKIGELHVYDLMLILILSNAVQNSMTESNAGIWVSFISAGTLLLLGWAFARLFVDHPAFERHLMSVPAVLVHNGRIQRTAMRREQIAEGELMMAIRQQGLNTLADVQVAVLETDGTISVVPLERASPEE